MFLQDIVLLNIFSLKIKLSDKIAVGVKDLQTPFLPLIYEHEFSDYTLRIGANILSQKWRTKDLTASIRGRQLFRYISIYVDR